MGSRGRGGCYCVAAPLQTGQSKPYMTRIFLTLYACLMILLYPMFRLSVWLQREEWTGDYRLLFRKIRS